MARAGWLSIVSFCSIAAVNAAGLPPDLAVTTVPSQQHDKPEQIPLSKLTGKITMVGFISALCPISNDYVDRMNALYRDQSGRPGVRLVFLYPNSNESLSQIGQHRRATGILFPVYRDVDAKAAIALGARNTPEFFVLGQDGSVQYRGPLDDARNPARVKLRALDAALTAVQAGREPEAKSLRALGCAIHKPLAHR